MDTINEDGVIDTSLEFFGKKFVIPVFAKLVGAIPMHYSDKYSDISYNDILVKNVLMQEYVHLLVMVLIQIFMKKVCQKIKEVGGMGIPTIKPWFKDIKREMVRI